MAGVISHELMHHFDGCPIQNSPADRGIRSTSGNIFNDGRTLRLKLDGVKVKDETTDVLGCLQSRTIAYEFDLTPQSVENPVYNIEVIANPSNIFLETDRCNNTAERNLGTKVDLSLDGEVAGEPVEHIWQPHPS